MSQKNLITIILDKSGSMSCRRDATISALNEYIDSLREESGDNRISLVTFSSLGTGFSQPQLALDKVLVAEPLASVRKLSGADMQCTGGTPLLSAIKETIDAIERSLGNRRDIRPVVVIQTDGEENASVGVTRNDIKSLIQRKEGEGWEFVFMGCGINAYSDAMQLGLSAEKIMSYGEMSSAAAFRAASSATKAYLSGASATMAYVDSEKMAAGDVFLAQAKRQENN